MLLFVYALDSGLFNEVTNFAHKLVSPETYACNLCRLTNGMVSAKREWSDFVKGLGVETKFYHRDTFAKKFSDAPKDYPAAYVATDEGPLRAVATGEELRACKELAELINLVRERVRGIAAPEAGQSVSDPTFPAGSRSTIR
jgi:hypothetical protein